MSIDQENKKAIEDRQDEKNLADAQIRPELPDTPNVEVVEPQEPSPLKEPQIIEPPITIESPKSEPIKPVGGRELFVQRQEKARESAPSIPSSNRGDVSPSDFFKERVKALSEEPPPEKKQEPPRQTEPLAEPKKVVPADAAQLFQVISDLNAVTTRNAMEAIDELRSKVEEIYDDFAEQDSVSQVSGSAFTGVRLAGTTWVTTKATSDPADWMEITGTMAADGYLIIDTNNLVVYWSDVEDNSDYLECIPVSILSGLIVVILVPHYVT